METATIAAVFVVGFAFGVMWSRIVYRRWRP
jgi:hypothetical protein